MEVSAPVDTVEGANLSSLFSDQSRARSEYSDLENLNGHVQKQLSSTLFLGDVLIRFR